MKVYILLDASGSMVPRWAPALESINGYVSKLASDNPTAAITVAAFSSNMSSHMEFRVLRDHQIASEWKPLGPADGQANGGTPLYDAIARLVAMAEKNPDARTVLIIETDGEENTSTSTTNAGAKEHLDRCRLRDWQVVFLGADFDAFAQSAAVGVSYAQSLNMIGEQGRRHTYHNLATASASYGATGQSINFTQEDRDAAAGKQ